MSTLAAFLLAMAGAGARPVAASIIYNAGGPGTFYFDLSAASVGQFALVYAGFGGPPALSGSHSGGWSTLTPSNWATYSYTDRIFYHLIDAGDLVPNVVGVDLQNDGFALVLIYDGPTSAALRSATQNSGATVTVPGFTLASTSQGVVFFTSDRDGAVGAVVPPAGAAQRVAPTVEGAFAIGAFDYLAPGDYPEQAVTFSGFANVSFDQRVYAVELLR